MGEVFIADGDGMCEAVVRIGECRSAGAFVDDGEVMFGGANVGDRASVQFKVHVLRLVKYGMKYTYLFGKVADCFVSTIRKMFFFAPSLSLHLLKPYTSR